MSGVVLSGAIRTNLTTLQNTGTLQAKIQERLATGRKVNSAIDNPTSFFTASSLNRRANDLSALLDGMAQGIKTLEAADNAMKAITKNIETMQANIRQARQDKSFKGTSFTLDTATIGNSTVKSLSFSGGAVGTTPVDVRVNSVKTVTGAGGFAGAGSTVGSNSTFTIQSAGLNGGAAVSVAAVTGDTVDTLVTKINAALDAATGGDGGFVAEAAGGQIKLTSNLNATFTIGGTVTGTGLTAATTSAETAADARSVDQLVTMINGTAALSNRVKASNDAGRLRIENLSTEALSVVGASATAVTGGTGASNTTTIGGNEVRKSLINQFNDLRTQLDKLASDASYNGVNLVKADKLKITFNESGTSSIEIQAKSVSGTVRGITTESASLDIGAADATEFSSDTALDTRLDELSAALVTVQAQSSEFGAALTTVQSRQDFTKAMIGTLQTGADSLTLADANEEAAKLLSLNTRQQLAQTALSLATQADQAVLRLF